MRRSRASSCSRAGAGCCGRSTTRRTSSSRSPVRLRGSDRPQVPRGGDMAAAKTIEIIGRSTTGSDDAVRQALDEARRTVRNITGVDVVSKGLRGDGLTEWRALVRVAFVVDRDEDRPPTGARRSAAAEAAALRLEEREG